MDFRAPSASVLTLAGLRKALWVGASLGDMQRLSVSLLYAACAASPPHKAPATASCHLPLQDPYTVGFHCARRNRNESSSYSCRKESKAKRMKRSAKTTLEFCRWSQLRSEQGLRMSWVRLECTWNCGSLTVALVIGVCSLSSPEMLAHLKLIVLQFS